VLDLRFTPANSDAEVRLLGDRSGRVRLDPAELVAHAVDPAAYGLALGTALFADAEAWTAFSEARARAASVDAPMRLRLYIDASAPELPV